MSLDLVLVMSEGEPLMDDIITGKFNWGVLTLSYGKDLQF